MKKDFPILEYDHSKKSVLNPEELIKRNCDVPESCVISFFYDVIDHLAEKNLLREIASLNSEMGKHPVYELEIGDRKVALFHPGVGAPLAAALFEEVIALGCKKFIACGGAGVLDKNITAGHLIIPVAALRDEGTSYHYLPASRCVEPSPKALNAIKKVLEEHNIEYTLSKTWTTDGVYRETRDKVLFRKEEGCLTVEMEAAALFAVGKFRNVDVAQILYGGDNLDSIKWDDRDWQNNWNVREKLIWLAAEASLLI